MPEQKSVWFRLGVTIPLTDEEYDLCKNNREAGGELVKEKILRGEYRLDGESYCPYGQWPENDDPDREFDEGEVVFDF